MDRTYVSLDLETTGLSPESDEIIEIGAVKFQGEQVIETFHSLVNPRCTLPYRIQVLCGITPSEVESAPLFSAVAPGIVSFLGSHPVIGHNLAFDLGFLYQRGVELSNTSYDTFEMARIFHPCLSNYSLSSLAKELVPTHPPEHRALPDALATKGVFLALLERAFQLDLSLISEMIRLTAGTDWSLNNLLRDLGERKVKAAFSTSTRPSAEESSEEGVDLLGGESRRLRSLTPNPEKTALDLETLQGMLGSAGLLERFFPNYEHRPEQASMMQAVAEALNDGEHLVVEAGPGTGKSIAYLLPAILFALRNNAHVVLSTNTINLQEQLINKDIPDLLRALRRGQEPLGSFRAVSVKGRGNYLCLRRWDALRRGEGLSLEETKVLLRLLVWLASSASGDRAELNLMWWEMALWNRLCAQSDDCLAGQCPHQRRSTCFLYRAREGAKGAHLIVVNHALLLSDMVASAKVLPEYDHLVIDEAHHLEEEATEQLGFRVTQAWLFDLLNRLGEESADRSLGLLYEIRNCLRGSTVASSTQNHLGQLAQDLRTRVSRARALVSQFFEVLSDFVHNHSEDQGEYERRLRLTRAMRVQPLWPRVEIAWENLGLALADIEDGLSRLYSGLESLSDAKISDYESLMLELSSTIYSSSELRQQMDGFVAHSQGDSIYWCVANGQRDLLTLYAAPLHVGGALQEGLFGAKESVILTGATLSIEGHFEYLKERLGLDYARELVLGSPFNYMLSTLVYIPQDIPDPGTSGYQGAIERLLIELCRATQGSILVLFTSHAALRETHAAIRGPLEEEEILVLGQGVDGSPKQLVNMLKGNPKTVLLGTSSLWEGVDVVGEALSVVAMARLPFSVPRDPVFAARSELFEDAFNQYAVPQAVLKFKQGFGRLIRSRTDRGVVVLLDRRIVSKHYGSAFLQSLPPCTVIRGRSREMPSAVVGWLQGGSRAAESG